MIKIRKLLLFSVLAYLYSGFFFRDPYLFERDKSLGPKIGLVISLLQLIIPPLILVLYLLLKRRVVKMSNLMLVILGSLASILVLSPFCFFLYERASRFDTERYHAFLQLQPPMPDVEALKDRSKTHVFFLGGSTTEWADSQGRDWPSEVERALTSKGEKIDAHNLGRVWYNSSHSLIHYLTGLRPHRPDLVVLMQGVNDFFQNADFGYTSVRPFQDDYGHFLGPYRRLANRESLFEDTLRVLSAAWYYEPREEVATATFPGLETFRRNVETMIHLTAMDGAKFVLVTQPHVLGDDFQEKDSLRLQMNLMHGYGKDKYWSYTVVRDGLRRYNQVVRELAMQYKVPLIDLEKEVPQSFTYFRDEVHFTDAGFKCVAERVSRALETIAKT